MRRQGEVSWRLILPFISCGFARTCSGELMTSLRSNSNPNALTCGFRLQHIHAGRSFFFSPHSCVERGRVFLAVVVLVQWHTLRRKGSLRWGLLFFFSCCRSDCLHAARNLFLDQHISRLLLLQNEIWREEKEKNLKGIKPRLFSSFSPRSFPSWKCWHLHGRYRLHAPFICRNFPPPRSTDKKKCMKN